MQIVDKDTKQILDAYEGVLTSNLGQIMLEDLERTFLDSNLADEESEINERLGHIPPEFRAWVNVGERNVVSKMKNVIKLNRETELENDNEEN